MIEQPDPTRTQPQEFQPRDTTIVGSDGNANVPQLSDYILGEFIAKGGMGEVYRGLDVGLNREVAIKILQEKFAPTSSTARRFIEEAQITGQLQHPGIPPIHHVGTWHDGRPFLAMKLIKGDTLDELLKTNANINRLAIFEAIAQAVGYAHAHGVIHRDLKPANIMVGAFGEVQVMDWGLAKVLTSPQREQGPDASTDPNTTAAFGTQIRSTREEFDETNDGDILGTPAFMPPEQAIGAIDEIDVRSDVFGLGAILCAMLTGKPPYSGGDAKSTRQLAARAKLDDAFTRLDASNAEPGLVALCKRCLSAEKSSRLADGDAVAKEVAELRREAEERAKQAEMEENVRIDRKQRRGRLIKQALKIYLPLLIMVLLTLDVFNCLNNKRITEKFWMEGLKHEIANLAVGDVRDAKNRPFMTQSRSSSVLGLYQYTGIAHSHDWYKALTDPVPLESKGSRPFIPEIISGPISRESFVWGLYRRNGYAPPEFQDKLREARKWFLVADELNDQNTQLPIVGLLSPKITVERRQRLVEILTEHGWNYKTTPPETVINNIKQTPMAIYLIPLFDYFLLLENDPSDIERLRKILSGISDSSLSNRLRDPKTWNSPDQFVEMLKERRDKVSRYDITLAARITYHMNNATLRQLRSYQHTATGDPTIAVLCGCAESRLKEPGALKEAIGYFNIARVHDRDSPYIPLTIAWLQHQDGDVQAAQTELKIANYLSKDSEEARRLYEEVRQQIEAK
jgi:serine/threonine protein kinase